MDLSQITIKELEQEYSRRRVETVSIRHPTDIIPAFKKWANKKQEFFFVAYLSSSYDIIKTEVISKGILNRTIVHPREVFRPAIRLAAAAVILGHNHPSGNIEPSHDDKEITSRLKEAGDIIGIPVLDHIIVTKHSHYSFKDIGVF